MQATWTVDKISVNAWRKLVDEYRDEPIPKERRTLNVQRKGIVLTKTVVWHRIIGCQVTTQQRSGRNTLVTKFLESASPLFDLKVVKKCASLEELAQDELTAAGLRMTKKVPKRLQAIYDLLEDGEWSTLLSQLETIRKRTTQNKERAVVNYLTGLQNGSKSKRFPGLGQKQSRNFIQWLGLSRWEVPLDSRVLRVLRTQGANFVPKGNSLADATVYLFVQDLLQIIASRLGIFPCELDACMFASGEGKIEDDDEEVDED